MERSRSLSPLQLLLDGDGSIVFGAMMVCSVQQFSRSWYNHTCIIPLEKPETNAVRCVAEEYGILCFAVTTQVMTMGDIDTDGGDCSSVVHRNVFCTCRSRVQEPADDEDGNPVSSFDDCVTFPIFITLLSTIFSIALDAYTNIEDEEKEEEDGDEKDASCGVVVAVTSADVLSLPLLLLLLSGAGIQVTI
jgi:hypothetical protein